MKTPAITVIAILLLAGMLCAQRYSRPADMGTNQYRDVRQENLRLKKEVQMLESAKRALEGRVQELRVNAMWERRINKALIGLCERLGGDMDEIKQLSRPEKAQQAVGFKKIGLGQIGWISSIEIAQILDSNNALVRIGGIQELFWFDGIPTAGLADGYRAQIEDLCIITGSKQYHTVGGSTSTVFVVQLFLVGDEIPSRDSPRPMKL